MKWNDFVKEKEEYAKLWERMKKEYSGDIRKFLDKSYLVVFYHHRQIVFDADAFYIARENGDFFAMDKNGKEYMDLVVGYKRVEKDTDNPEKERLLKKISVFDVSSLSVVEHRFEVRFPTVAMDFIQQIKQSKYCNQGLTDMRTASIRVILK